MDKTITIPQEMAAAELFDYLAERLEVESKETPQVKTWSIDLPAGAVVTTKKGGVSYRNITRREYQAAQGIKIEYVLYHPDKGKREFQTIDGYKDLLLMPGR